MTKEKAATLKMEETICGKTFWTVWGMSRQLPGRTKGSKTSLAQMLVYIREGCPCFEHGGSVFFDKDLTEFLNWLKKRRPQQAKAAAKRRASRNFF